MINKLFFQKTCKVLIVACKRNELNLTINCGGGAVGRAHAEGWVFES